MSYEQWTKYDMEERILRLEKALVKVTAERNTLRIALKQIADWNKEYGSWPKNNDEWRRLLGYVTAQQVLPEYLDRLKTGDSNE